jgi:hypothetical protein
MKTPMTPLTTVCTVPQPATEANEGSLKHEKPSGQYLGLICDE